MMKNLIFTMTVESDYINTTIQLVQQMGDGSQHVTQTLFQSSSPMFNIVNSFNDIDYDRYHFSINVKNFSAKDNGSIRVNIIDSFNKVGWPVLSNNPTSINESFDKGYGEIHI